MVSICIVPWNSRGWTIRFMREVRQKTRYPYKVFISDNSDEPFVVDGKDVVYWWNGGNVGCPKALNEAFRRADSDLLVMANTDIVLESGWLRKMAQAYERHPEYWILVPAMNSPGQEIHTFSLEERCREMLKAPIGALWMFSKSRMLDVVGGLDESLGMVGCGDLLLCYKVWKAGGKVGVFGDVYVHHLKGRVAGCNLSPELWKNKVQVSRALMNQKYGFGIHGLKSEVVNSE